MHWHAVDHMTEGEALLYALPQLECGSAFILGNQHSSVFTSKSYNSVTVLSLVRQ